MKSNEAQLLDSLGSGVRLFDTSPVENPGIGTDFDQMLGGAIKGRPKTDLGVVFAPAVSGMFEQSDHATIANGIDQAAAAGVDHALILHGERTLRVDVRNRIVLDAYRIDQDLVIDDIDGFVSLKKHDESGIAAPVEINETGMHASARVVRNASLVHALAGRATNDHDQ